MLSFVIAAVCCMTGVTGAIADTDEFDKYPGNSLLSGPPANPQIVLRRARLFRTVLRAAAAEGPNFNGHYRTVHWGCGSNCIEWTVIDLRNGVVWFAKEPALSCWAPDEPRGLDWPDWIETRLSSRLLYLHECEHGFSRGPRTFDIRHVYEWRKETPVLLRTERFTVEASAAQ